MAKSSRALSLPSIAWRGLALITLVVQLAWQPLQAAAAAPSSSPVFPATPHLPPAAPLYTATASTSLNLPATVLLGQSVAFTVDAARHDASAIVNP